MRIATAAVTQTDAILPAGRGETPSSSYDDRNFILYSYIVKGGCVVEEE